MAGRYRRALAMVAISMLSGGCALIGGGPGPAPVGSPLSSDPATSSPVPSPGPTSASTKSSKVTAVVAAAGDIACEPGRPISQNSCAHVAVSDAILADKAITTVLALGDNQYEDGTLAKYQSEYDKSWGRFKDITRPVPGNHDYRTPGAAGYYDYFGAAAGDPDKGYYSFDVGGWHFIALNSEEDTENGGAQVAWLKRDLESHQTGCTVAYFHRPRWSSGERHGDSDTVAPFFEALYDANADLILVGHEHNYERFVPLNPRRERDDARGIVQIVSGLGGKTQYPLAGGETTAAKNNGGFGYVRMALRTGSADIEYVPVVGTFRDSYTLSCH
jgi:hypothetical protein